MTNLDLGVKTMNIMYPKKCNICGGDVIYCSNAKIYGVEYGSGKCYLCTNCGAYVGTHKPRPKEALGLLANARMRNEKMKCHNLFDGLWKGKPKAQKKRRDLYLWLAKRMNTPLAETHFGYMNLEQLRKAYGYIKELADKGYHYTSKGEIEINY